MISVAREVVLEVYNKESIQFSVNLKSSQSEFFNMLHNLFYNSI